LLRRTVGMLERERLVGADVEARSYSTPRRLAVAVKGVLARQEDLQEEMLGPSAKIAFKDGVAGPAAVAFAKKAGVEVAALRTVTNAKGEYVAATSVKAGRAAAEVIAAELPKELAGIYWAKTMYWRAGRPERFVRPVRWIVALLGEEVVPVSFGGYVAGRVTFGHRVLAGPEPIELGSANEYVEKLTGGFVMAEAELRRHTIRKALDRVCRTAAGTRWREDHALVDKMTHMTEWPSVILGGFEPEYLELPEEVLVTVMRDHQNYFAVEDKRGKLSPNFLAVLNTVADAAGEAVIRHGNERVLRARWAARECDVPEGSGELSGEVGAGARGGCAVGRAGDGTGRGSRPGGAGAGGGAGEGRSDVRAGEGVYRAARDCGRTVCAGAGAL
jgi:glycyl-tRNA synthetase beta chain